MYTMIIIDDNSHIINWIKNFLSESNMDITLTDTAINGKEGLQKVSEQKPDIVITDIDMPYVNGLTMIKDLVNEGCRAKFILLTGTANLIMRELPWNMALLTIS
jgi:two-component system response regulator YesN